MEEFDKRCMKSFREKNPDWNDIPDKYILNSYTFTSYKLGISFDDFKKSLKDNFPIFKLLLK